jgi:putative oxidoreductase
MRQPATVNATTRASLVGHRVLWILQIVAALGFLGAAVRKLTGADEVVSTFHGLGWPDWTRFALAGLELLGSVALVVPKLVGLAAAAFVALTTGAIVAQLLTGASVMSPLVLLLISAIVAWAWRRTTIALWTGVGNRLRDRV